MSGVRPALVPIDKIVEGLRDRIEELCRVLLPNGHRDMAEWREARKAQGGLGDSLCVHIGGGNRRGAWMHGAADEQGDALDLVAYLRFGGNKRDAIIWAKAWLGLDGADAAALATGAPRVPVPRDAREDEETVARRAAAHSIYLASAPIEGSPVEAYLRGRGLDVTRLGFPLHAIRCHAGLWDKYTRRHWPAMVGAITGADGKFLAAHQTWLEVLRDGAVRKAPITDHAGAIANKRVLGRYRGGAIRLWRGTRVDPDTGEIKRARRLADCKSGVWVDVTEGIEDGLTVAIADNATRVLVGVSISNMLNLLFPPSVEGVVLWKQNDTPGSKADQSFSRVVERFAGNGLKIAIAAPPIGVKDVNDMVQPPARTEIAS